MAPVQRLVMLTFATAAPAPAARVAIGNLPFGQLILDKDLKVTYANAVAMRADASLPGGLLGVSGLELIPTSALHPSGYARALQGNQYHEDSVEIAAATGPRWFEIDVQPLQAASGIVGLVVLSIEVTERRRKQPQKPSERRLLALTEHARDIISVASPGGRLLYVCGGVQNSLGYSSEERQTHTLFEHVHPDDRAGLSDKHQQMDAREIDSYSREF